MALMVDAWFKIMLAADTDVAAYVGNRIFPAVHPQGFSLPAILYDRISTVWSHTMDGECDMVYCRLQYTCLSETRGEARQLCDLVRRKLSQFSGWAGSGSPDQVWVYGTFPEGDTDSFVGNEKKTVHAAILDLGVFYKQLAPAPISS